MRIILDLDDTLIDTYSWWEAAWQEISYEYADVSSEEGAKDRLREFYLHQDNLPSTYDFERHLSFLGLKSQVDSIYQLLASRLRAKELDYPGVDGLVKTAVKIGEVAIVTFGIQQVQKAKVASRPILDGIEMISTLEPKVNLIEKMRAQESSENIVVIDDANIGKQLEEKGIDFIWPTWSETAVPRNQRKGLELWPIEAKTPADAAELLVQKAA